MELLAQPERVQQQEEVHLADAELDVVTGRRLLPAQEAAVTEEVGLLVGMEHADLVDPAAEVRADADVGGGRDEPRPDVGLVRQPQQQPPERLLSS